MFYARCVKKPLEAFILCNLLVMNCFSGDARVSLRQDAKGAWELVRNGETMRVLGVGGTKFLPLAREMGANSVRVWDTKQLLEKYEEQPENSKTEGHSGQPCCNLLFILSRKPILPQTLGASTLSLSRVKLSKYIRLL